MSLTFLVAIVAVGITAVVVAVHLSGGTRIATLENAEMAKQRFADDFADLAIRDVWLTEDREAAFLALEDGRAGVVSALGGNFLARVLRGDEFASPPARDGRTVILLLSDYTWRGGLFIFASEDEAQAVAELIGADADNAQGVLSHG
jgi:hypothetical protein